MKADTQRSLHIPKWIKQLYKLLEHLSKFWAVKFAIKIFVTVPKFPVPDREKPFREAARKELLNFKQKKIALFHWGEEGKPAILVVHGWAGRASQLGKIAVYLAKNGFHVIGIDLPAHGESEGKRSSFIEFSTAINLVGEKFPNLHGIVAHSAGGLGSVHAIHSGLKCKKLVCIGTLVDAPIILTDYQREMRMKAKAIQLFNQKLTEYYGGSAEDFSALNLAKDLSLQGLILHDKRDKDVGFEQAELLHKNWSNSRLILSEGLGHRRILSDDLTAERILKFLQED